MTAGRPRHPAPIRALVGVLALVTGCGQTGPLFLPDETAANGAGAPIAEGNGADGDGADNADARDNGVDREADGDGRRGSGAAR